MPDRDLLAQLEAERKRRQAELEHIVVPPAVKAAVDRHSEAYDPGPRRRIGGHYFDVDDVPPRGDRDY